MKSASASLHRTYPEATQLENALHFSHFNKGAQGTSGAKIMPSQEHSWLRAGGRRVFGGRELLYLTIYLSDSGLRNAKPPTTTA